LRKLLIGAVVGVIGLVAATVALAVTGTQQKYTETFSTSKATKSAASTFNLTSNDPTAPNGQPNPARTTTIIFPKGTIINYKAVKQCSASDLDFQNKGASACPGNTKIGSGTASANTGFPPPITEIGAQVTAFNGKKVLILYIVPNNGASNPFVIRAQLQGGKTTPRLFTKVPPNCIPPGSPNTTPPCGGKEAPLDSFKLTTNKKGTTKSPYLKTPPCPKSKKWTFTAKLTYRDDPPKTLTSTQKCKK
jgi:hypothetical protein